MSRRDKSGWGLNSTFMIGKQDNPMMKRWRLIQTPMGGVYVHFIYREDLDPIGHDHPWAFWSLVLKGGYTELLQTHPRYPDQPKRVSHRRFSLHHFPLKWAHRIISVEPGTITLVLVGPKKKQWGFWQPVTEVVDDHGLMARTAVVGHEWVDYRDALGLRPTEGVQ